MNFSELISKLSKVNAGLRGTKYSRCQSFIDDAELVIWLLYCGIWTEW